MYFNNSLVSTRSAKIAPFKYLDAETASFKKSHMRFLVKINFHALALQ
jgi:hypothetical protein